MSEESKSNAPATPTPLGEIEHGPSKFDQFMEKNLKKVILLAFLIVIGVAALVITNQLAEAKDREAGNALLSADSPEDYRKVSKDYSGSGAAASAQLLLAGQLFDEGKEAEAIEVLKTLTQSDHSAAAQAKFALASIQFKQGQTEEAKANYEAILAGSDSKYLHPFSLVALGDIAAAAGEEEKAKEYYQRKVEDYSEYADQNIAVSRLNLVGVDLAEKVPPPPAPTPAPNPNQGLSPAFTTPLVDPATGAPIPSRPVPQPAAPVAPPAAEEEAEETEEEQEAATSEAAPLPTEGEAVEAVDDEVKGTPTFQVPIPTEE